MNLRWTALVLGVAACASTETLAPAPPENSNSLPATPPAADSGADAAPEVDAGPCADCEYFPATCSPDTLCPNGPFASSPSDSNLPPVAQINVIRGRSVSDVWAAGTSGSLAHFDGTSWKRVDLGTLDTLNALWLRDSEDIALAQMARVYRHDVGAAPPDGGWPLTELPYDYDVANARLISAWSASGSPWLWCTTRSWSPTTGLWRMRRLPSNELELQSGVDPATCSGAGCTLMTSIHGVSANELWAVGDKGSAVQVLDADGDTPSVNAFNTQTRNTLNGVWVASSSDVWAVGAMGTIRHYTGAPILWDVVSDVGTTEDLRAVWGSSSTDVWAVGDGGLVLHYDGKSWSRIKIAGLGKRRPNLTAVWVPAPGHVWVGGEGVILSLGGKP
ncbi:MAG: hypothetical protein BGO98_11365 [Myxococcales bacterium 68-20]|nr:hypothetical protein [Myxococcales bacterium]OJY16786.1 MAG: hypothetical protein BGO98_11365 [Myxococcales bacterium 68-20]